MKTTYTIAAIAMFAVILGMGALSPAMADHKKTVPNNDTSKARTLVCHLCEDEVDEFTGDVISPAHYDGLLTSSKGATNGHLNHEDLLIGDADGEISLDACRELDPPVQEPTTP